MQYDAKGIAALAMFWPGPALRLALTLGVCLAQGRRQRPLQAPRSELAARWSASMGPHCKREEQWLILKDVPPSSSTKGQGLFFEQNVST